MGNQGERLENGSIRWTPPWITRLEIGMGCFHSAPSHLIERQHHVQHLQVGRHGQHEPSPHRVAEEQVESEKPKGKRRRQVAAAKRVDARPALLRVANAEELDDKRVALDAEREHKRGGDKKKTRRRRRR